MSGGKPLPRVLSGTFRLTRFRADGLLLFDATPQAFFNSLAPLMAFPLVGGGLALLNGTLRTGIVNLLASVIALLAPPVLSHALARRWGREEFWLRYAVASNWCQSAMTLAALLIGFATAAASWGQPNGREAVLSAIVFVLFYWLILGWFWRHAVFNSRPGVPCFSWSCSASAPHSW